MTGSASDLMCRNASALGRFSARRRVLRHVARSCLVRRQLVRGANASSTSAFSVLHAASSLVRRSRRERRRNSGGNATAVPRRAVPGCNLGDRGATAEVRDLRVQRWAVRAGRRSCCRVCFDQGPHGLPPWRQSSHIAFRGVVRFPQGCSGALLARRDRPQRTPARAVGHV